MYNLKGGVGKTAAAVNLAYFAARSGLRTLIWDLDPQAATTYYFRIKPKVRGGSERLFKANNRLGSVIKGTDFDNLDLVPGDFTLRGLDLLLAAKKQRRRRLRSKLGSLGIEYDCVFLDCPPSISLASENVFNAADLLLVPLIPSPLSLRAYAQLKHFLQCKSSEEATVIPFFSMVDRRKGLHHSVVESFSRQHPELARTAIPYAREVEAMGEQRLPVPCFAPRSRSALAFEHLWRELSPRLFEHAADAE
ncbi:MAG: ParA family protein [Gammaproteobacteria bacterium]